MKNFKITHLRSHASTAVPTPMAQVLVLTLAVASSLVGCKTYDEATTARLPVSDSVSISASTPHSTFRDWDETPVPADPGEGMAWELHPLSDDFNYTAPAEGKSAVFYERWREGFINRWRGPGLTRWEADHSSVSDGHLNIMASRGSRGRVSAGCITSKESLIFPVYIEVRARLSNQVLASNAWMLSRDSTQEIDILEAYGSDRPDQAWYAQRLHLSHHVFIRRPFQDYQPTDEDEFSYEGDKDLTWLPHPQGGVWRSDWHRIGVYWIDPWNLEYYVDGELVRVTRPEEIDPRDYTNGTGLNKPMQVILNTEDHDWRSGANPSITPTDEELADDSRNTYRVDWVRIYKPVAVATDP